VWRGMDVELQNRKIERQEEKLETQITQIKASPAITTKNYTGSLT
jgi:hypothetical protein